MEEIGKQTGEFHRLITRELSGECLRSESRSAVLPPSAAYRARGVDARHPSVHRPTIARALVSGFRQAKGRNASSNPASKSSTSRCFRSGLNPMKITRETKPAATARMAERVPLNTIAAPERIQARTASHLQKPPFHAGYAGRAEQRNREPLSEVVRMPESAGRAARLWNRLPPRDMPMQPAGDRCRKLQDSISRGNDCGCGEGAKHDAERLGFCLKDGPRPAPRIHTGQAQSASPSAANCCRAAKNHGCDDRAATASAHSHRPLFLAQSAAMPSESCPGSARHPATIRVKTTTFGAMS